MEQFNEFVTAIDNFIWGIPLIILILGIGVYLTIRLRILQVFHLPRALKFMVQNEADGTGEITSFGALCTALSATIGNGNIVGVATAIVAGGPGALFWMWIAAFFGMATKFAEGVLAIKFRHISPEGHVLGGPFYYIESGMGERWKWLAKTFAFFGAAAGLLGIGTITQVNGITSSVQNFFDQNSLNTVTVFDRSYSWSIVISGALVAICATLVIVGGIQRISHFAQVIIPFMIIAYVSICMIVIITNFTKIPYVFSEVIHSAFGLRAVSGGALGAMLVSMQKGIARGVFSNEAGLGSAPIAAAAAKTKEPVRQGLVSMTGTFIDTIIVCTMTGTAIILTGAWDLGLNGIAVTAEAFRVGLPFDKDVSSVILMVSMICFAFTTILGWEYYGERCLEYIAKGRKTPVTAYRWLYIAAVCIGPYMTVEAVWGIADIFNGLMAIPNLIALLVLSNIVVEETNLYIKKLKNKN